MSHCIISIQPLERCSCRMRIALTDYSSLEEVLQTIRNLHYEGGSRRTGDALKFLAEHVFGPAITRDHVPKVRCFNQRAVRPAQGACIWYTHTYTHSHP